MKHIWCWAFWPKMGVDCLILLDHTSCVYFQPILAKWLPSPHPQGVAYSCPHVGSSYHDLSCSLPPLCVLGRGHNILKFLLFFLYEVETTAKEKYTIERNVSITNARDHVNFGGDQWSKIMLSIILDQRWGLTVLFCWTTHRAHISSPSLRNDFPPKDVAYSCPRTEGTNRLLFLYIRHI